MNASPKNIVQSSNHRAIFAVSVFLVLATFAAFWQVQNFEFINYDDDIYVFENSHVQNGLTLDALIWAFSAGHAANWHPLTWLSHMIDIQIFGLWAGGHHLTNLFFHVISTLLLFLVFQKMTASIWRSALVAALFALHPLHIQSVAWVAERKDVLSTFFWMLTLWAYVRYVHRPAKTSYLWILLFFICGLMSKPMVMTLPFVLMLLDFWPLNRIHMTTPAELFYTNIWQITREKIPLFIITAISAGITFFVQQHGGAVKSFEKMPFFDRIANALISYVAYLAKTVYPVNLAVFYPYPDAFPLWRIAVAIFILTIITTISVAFHRNKPFLIVGWLWFLGTMVPVIGLVQVGGQSMADRYTYLPLIGVFIMVAWSISMPAPDRKWLRIGTMMGVMAAIFVLWTVTWFQTGYWKNSQTLFERALAVTSNNAIMHNNLGTTLLNEKETDAAIHHYQEAVRISPRYADAHFNIGSALQKKGDIKEAIQSFSRALALNPKHTKARNNLANALMQQGDLAGAVRHFQIILERRPDHVEANINMGAALTRLGQIDAALFHYQAAIKSDPYNPEAYNNMGVLFVQKNMLAEARIHFKKALTLRQEYASAINNLRRLDQMQP